MRIHKIIFIYIPIEIKSQSINYKYDCIIILVNGSKYSTQEVDSLATRLKNLPLYQDS